MFHAAAFLDENETDHWAIFDGTEHVWEALEKIAPYLLKNLKPANHGDVIGQAYIGENVYIGKGTRIEPGAVIHGPAWIGENCEVRTNAYIRGNVIAGNNCVLGNASEFKNCLLFNGCQVPHFNYVGDSILGAKAHLGAGVICSNLKLYGTTIRFTYNGREFNTGLRKFGAILGDHAEVGCNAVLNPGSILGRRSLVYPTANWRGVLSEDHMAKVSQEIVTTLRRD